MVNNSHKKRSVVSKFSSPDEFNEYFVEVVDGTLKDILDGGAAPASRIVVDINERFYTWSPITSRYVVKIVRVFQTLKSPVVYDMTVHFLQQVVYTVANHRARLINNTA